MDSAFVRERIGLGCSKLGSLSGIRGRDAELLIETALESGVSFFDTASVYGQGDSERILGRVLRKRNVPAIVVTKAGQHFPWWASLLEPLKPALAGVVTGRRLGGMVARRRTPLLPRNFAASFLKQSTNDSLRRLGMDHVDILLLHSPTEAVIRGGEAMSTLQSLQQSGKARLIGVACDDAETAITALRDPRVEAIEAPLWPWTSTSEKLLVLAGQKRVFVIARGLLSATLTQQQDGKPFRSPTADALSYCLTRPEINRLLVGTTKVHHLTQFLSLVSRLEKLTGSP